MSAVTLGVLLGGGLGWNKSGGSGAESFVIYAPFALSIGLSLGLPFRERWE